jgi:hypothetical protein
MWLNHFFKLRSYFRLAITIVVCLLITSLLSRSLVARPSERLQKIYSLTGASSQPEVDCDEEDSSQRPIIYLVKRIKDENDFSKHLENCIAIDWLSQLGWFSQFQRIPFPTSQLKLVSNSTNSIEKPPKV